MFFRVIVVVLLLLSTYCVGLPFVSKGSGEAEEAADVGTFVPLSAELLAGNWTGGLLEAAADGSTTCEYDSDCNHGSCGTYTSRQFPNGTRVCKCDKGWITTDKKGLCNYSQKDKITAFCLSFFLGEFGADWYYLADGDGFYIFMGCLKFFIAAIVIMFLFSLCDAEKAGAGIVTLWVIIFWLVDWIRILTDDFHDGHGHPISSW